MFLGNQFPLVKLSDKGKIRKDGKEKGIRYQTYRSVQDILIGTKPKEKASSKCIGNKSQVKHNIKAVVALAQP